MSIWKARTLLLLVATALLSPMPAGFAAENRDQGQAAPALDNASPSAELASPHAAPVASQEPAVAPAVAAAKPKSPEEELRAQIDGTKWLLELTPMSGGGKAKPSKDAVKFGVTKIGSEHLAKQGYPESNYTLTIGKDGTAVWETMQTNEGEGVAFWRGEFHGDVMRGMLSKHPVKGDPEDFSFSGREESGKSIGTSEPTPAAAIQPASSAPAPTTQPSQPSKKKKRGH